VNQAQEVVWAAGLFEGEGTWIVRSPRGKGTKPTCVITLQMCDRDVVERFATVMNCGKVTKGDNREEKNPNHRPIWRWSTARRADCLRIAEMFLPYMGNRRARKAREIIEAAQQIDGRAERRQRP
jgi:hypothetical protein